LIEKGGVQHYTWIKDLNRLLHSQSKYEGRKYFCERCLHCFTREDLLAQHKPDYKGVNGCPMSTRMPAEDQKILKFINHHKQLKAPYIIYADFEALTTKIEGTELDPAKSNTQKTQHHETCGFGYVVVRCDGHTEAPVVYHGPDAATRFLEHLSREETNIKRTLSNPAPMEMTPKDTTIQESAQDCHCHRNLKLYLSLGMRLKKIHRALRFDQRPWMEPYIRHNTELRKRATNDFEKDLYKLMNNRKRVDVELVRSSEEDRLRKLITSVYSIPGSLRETVATFYI
jgi:hypothetical protein